MKTCTKCGETKPLDEFSREARVKDGRRAECAECRRAGYAANPEKERESVRKYRNENPAAGRAKDSKRRAAKLKRTPPWADFESIKEFFLGCPPGHHVDHILPLQGELVSGLHVLDNLQYLPASENLSKSNRFNIEEAA